MRHTMLFCSQCFSYSNSKPIPTPTRKAAWLPSGTVPCARVTLSLLPAQVPMQAEEQGTDPILYILHKHLGKPMEGYSTPSLQWHCQLETLKLSTKIGLTFGSNFSSAVFPICPRTFLMKDSQIDNKYLDFLQGEHWHPTTKNSNPNDTGV